MKIRSEIEKYCKANKIDDVDKFIDYLLRKAFYIEKYGLSPNDSPESGKPIEIETVNEPNTAVLSDSNKKDDKVIKKTRKNPQKGIKIVKTD